MLKTIKIQLPNFFTIIWFFICLDVSSFVICPSIKYMLGYAVFAAIFLCGIKLIIEGVNIHCDYFRIIKVLFTYIGIQCFGLLLDNGIIAYRIIAASFCIVIWLTYIICFDYVIQKIYVRGLFGVTFLIAIFYSIQSGGISNTYPAEILFLTLSFISIEMVEKRDLTAVDWCLIDILLCVCIYLSIGFHSRTTLLAISTVIVVYVLCKYINIVEKHFWIVVTSLAIYMYIYMNISNLPLYEVLEKYSYYMFGKHIDSSRPYLWQLLIESVDGIHCFFGFGTGTLPRDFIGNVQFLRYMPLFKDGSSHNSFIQLYIQNGLMGVCVITYLLYLFWASFVRKIKIIQGRFATAVFVGIILYNCFEVAMLQNKFFLGVIQWTIIGVYYRKLS